MFKFLIVMFFFFLLLVMLMGFSIFRSVVRILFGKGSGSEKSAKKRHTSKSNTYHNPSQSGKRKKIFTDKDGDYVDYEEIKD